MKTTTLAGISILYFAIPLSCATKKSVTTSVDRLSGINLPTMGRYAMTDGKLELITSGAHFGVSFSGEKCTLIVSLSPGQHHNYLQYELDGVYVERLRVDGAKIDTLEISVPSSRPHNLRVFKATEAHTGPVYVHEVIAQEAKALELSSLPVIEFIGNSITCGAAADPSEVPCGAGEYHDQHNAYQAYGPRVARALNAEFILSSVSGIGIYRNWNSDRPVMSEVYENTDLQENSSRRWKFDLFQPRIVSIALGTNDFSNGDGIKPRLAFDSATFIRQYVSFVKVVKSKYPDAAIALINSPMIGGSNNEVLIDCLKKVKRQIDSTFADAKPVALFFFEPLTPRGCTYHPSVDDHRIMAEQLIPFYNTLLQSQ